ncbi:hypothetical protein ABDK56_01250 [Sphingomonas sp. ASV193]|uniref:hypothetical protein n=1 Tax=Sphingomonas sp. ASV193 TaxID=3144405 RepID=UPI0032E911BA
MTDSPRSRRLRWLTFAEIVAVAGLVISALALWKSWGDEPARTTTVVEQRGAIPLALRGSVADEGRTLTISPVEASHSLDSLTLTAAGKPPIQVGSDGKVAASSLEALVGEPKGDVRSGRLSFTIAARYVEAGKDRTGGGRYHVGWQWVKGGLFGGHSLRVTGFGRG